MKETMALLAYEWGIGVAVCSVICIIAYLIFSILLVRSARKSNYDIGVSAMIPLWNVVVLVKKIRYVRRVSMPIEDDEEIEL